jgi:ABC-type polar amino acid transport system ATPase subunit
VLGDKPDRLRQRIGMVFQHFNLFPHRSGHGKVVESGPPEQVFEAAETERLQRFLPQVL